MMIDDTGKSARFYPSFNAEFRTAGKKDQPAIKE
jgi:hypothetical protein